jgi:uncharacterized protein YlaI
MQKNITLIDSSGKNFIVNASEKDYEKFMNFNSKYELEINIDGTMPLSISIEDNEPKKCRFCDKIEPEVLFNEITHIIPQLLNRAKPISTFECDDCNQYFSKFESDFGHYSLIDRVVQGHKKKQGSPKYKTKFGSRISILKDTTGLDNKMQEKIKELYPDNNVTIMQFLMEDGENGMNITESKVEITFDVKPYRPINIFRTLLKIGLSLVREDEINQYSFAKKCLLSKHEIEKKDENSAEEISMILYELSSNRNFFQVPIVYLFRKRLQQSDNLPNKIMVLFFGGSVYQIAICSDKNIQDFYQLTTFNIPIYSLYFNPFPKQTSENIKFREFLENAKVSIEPLYKSDLVKDKVKTFTINKDVDFKF